MKVYVDAGHGGKDSGAVGVSGRMEKDDNLKAAKALKTELEYRGHTVKMSRTGDTYPSLNARADDANAWGADVYISMHRNAAGLDANGGEVLYGTNASQKSIKLAEAVNSKMNAAAGFRNRGAKRQSATVLQRSKMPAVTVEAGFVTNSSDNAKFDSNFNGIIKAVADSIDEVIGKGTAAPGASAPAAAAPAEPPKDPYAYVLNSAADLYEYKGAGAAGTPVTLESYFDGDNYARVRDGNGKAYIVKWNALKKA